MTERAFATARDFPATPFELPLYCCGGAPRRQRFPRRIRYVRRRDNSWADMGSALLLAVVATVVLSGCGTFSGSLKADDALTAGLTAPSGVLPSTEPDGGQVVTSDQVVERV